KIEFHRCVLVPTAVWLPAVLSLLTQDLGYYMELCHTINYVLCKVFSHQLLIDVLPFQLKNLSWPFKKNFSFFF
ncbi:hypothetical protein ACQP3D_28315, partial [Escherichia coli]